MKQLCNFVSITTTKIQYFRWWGKTRPMKYPTIGRLTKRENHMVHEMMGGLAAKEIAAKNFLSTYTVETHIKSVRQKLGARNNVQVVVKYLSLVEDPARYLKHVGIALLFLSLQGYMTLSPENFDMRKPVRTSVRARNHKNRLYGN